MIYCEGTGFPFFIVVYFYMLYCCTEVLFCFISITVFVIRDMKFYIFFSNNLNNIDFKTDTIYLFTGTISPPLIRPHLLQ